MLTIIKYKRQYHLYIDGWFSRELTRDEAIELKKTGVWETC